MKKILPVLLLLFIALNNSCTDIDDNLEVARAENVIVKDSEMYDLIERVTTSTDDPIENIVCIDFVYPLEVKLYNPDLVRTDSVILWGDDEFSAFLASLTTEQALSISYPIVTTFTNGETFTINNNDELKTVIDQCSREDIVEYCNSVFASFTDTEVLACVWNVQYIAGNNNKYVGGTFLINPDNTLVFNYDGTDYAGNWIFLFVNDELHININLEGISQVAADWNIDRRIIFTATTIEIIAAPEIMLMKSCEDTSEYAVGDDGPAGGKVFYDKGSYSHGWRYIEAATEDLALLEWGCSAASIAGTNGAVGSGLANTAKIVNYHDSLISYYTNPGVCSNLNNGTVAAQNAITFTIDGVDGWFLPSADELSLMYSNLQTAGMGNFTTDLYWSSTEADTQHAKTVNFATGEIIDSPKASADVKTRPVRYF